MKVYENENDFAEIYPFIPYPEKWRRIRGSSKVNKMTLNEHNTLFDDVVKNFENYEEIKGVVHEILVADLYS